MRVDGASPPAAASELSPARVLLGGEHVAVRQAFAVVLEAQPDFEVVAQAGSLATAVDLVAEVDLAIVDLCLPDGLGDELVAPLRQASPWAHALILSAGAGPAHVARAVQRGAAAVLDKASPLDGLLGAARGLIAGEPLLSPDRIGALLAFDREHSRRFTADRSAIESLTEREVEIMRLMAQGLDTHRIARRLHISERTERNHVANIFAKLGVHSRLQALIACLRHGAVELD
jgi:DNA-binding NarL/FixJ family response regulator